MPNAWPSGEMLEKSAYMRNVVSRPWYYYISIIISISPIHCIGILYGIRTTAIFITNILCEKSLEMQMKNFSNRILVIVSLFIWIIGVMGGHTVIGILGAGYQSRFMLLLVPPCCVLTTMALHDHKEQILIPVVICMCYGIMGSMFYGIMFAPLFADFDYSIFNMLFNVILVYPTYSLNNEFSAEEVVSFLKHYGVKIG